MVLEYIHGIVEAAKAFEKNRNSADYLKLREISNKLLKAEADALDHELTWDDIINARSVGETIAKIENGELKK